MEKIVSALDSGPVQFPRRTLLKGACLAFASLVFPDLLSFPEQESFLPYDYAVFVDVIPNYDNTQVMRRLLSGLIGSELFDDEDALTVATMASGILDNRKRHGEDMLDVYKNMLTRLGWSAKNPQMIPLQEMITNPHYGKDSLENPYITFDIDEDKMSVRLNEFFEKNISQRVVNGSWEIGTTKITHVVREIDEDGYIRELGDRSYVHITEPYHPDFAGQNLMRLNSLCNHFADRSGNSGKLFVCSGGNEESNVIDRNRPENLLVVAERRRRRGSYLEVASIGADVYIKPSSFGKNYLDSSDCAAIVSALCSVIVNASPDISARELKQKILTTCCKDGDYAPSADLAVARMPTKILDPWKFFPLLRNPNR